MAIIVNWEQGDKTSSACIKCFKGAETIRTKIFDLNYRMILNINYWGD